MLQCNMVELDLDYPVYAHIAYLVLGEIVTFIVWDGK